MVLDFELVKELEERERSCHRSNKIEKTAVKKTKVFPAEVAKVKTVKCNCNCNSNPATNWWLALIAFLLFLMLCLNPNFE